MTLFDEMRKFSDWAAASSHARELVAEDRKEFFHELKENLSIENVARLDENKFSELCTKMQRGVADDSVLYKDILHMLGWFSGRIENISSKITNPEEKAIADKFINEIILKYEAGVIPIIQELKKITDKQLELFHQGPLYDLRILKLYVEYYEMEVAYLIKLKQETNVIVKKNRGKVRNIIGNIGRGMLFRLKQINSFEEKHPLAVGIMLMALIVIPLVGEVALGAAMTSKGVSIATKEVNACVHAAHEGMVSIEAFEKGLHVSKSVTEGVHIFDGGRIASKPLTE
jgi:hypothetical protein